MDLNKLTRQEELTKSVEIKFVLKGALLALLISAIVCVLTSVVLYFTSLTEGLVPYAVYITSILSIIVGAAYAARKANVKGWLHGGLTGLIYVLVLAVFALIFDLGFEVDMNYGMKLLIGFFAGALGGILGLNL